MWLALLAIVAVLIPLARVVPPLIELRIRSPRVPLVCASCARSKAPSRLAAAAALLIELDQIERRVAQIQVPLSYTDELYALKSHIQFVRRRLQSA